MNRYKLLIFDWDGTLVNSIDRIVESIGVASCACGLPVRDELAVKGIIGLSLPEAFAVLYPHIEDAALVQEFRRAYAEHYLALEVQPSASYPGVVESLKAFREKGYRLAVATGKGRRGLDQVLAGQGWEDFFDITRCADETASKPDPLMIQEVLAHCGVSPDQALMVGDSIFDLQMAQRAGVDCVAVTYGAQSADVLRAYSPCLIIDEFAQLDGWLQCAKI